MKTTITFHAAPRRGRERASVRKHTLPKCAATGLARYRDRHQARDGSKALAAGNPTYVVSMFACPDCSGGWHVEKNEMREPLPTPTSAPARAFIASVPSRRRRYFLWDVENTTCGAKATALEVSELWRILQTQAPGVAPHDHVVVGASRSVTRKYRHAIHGPNVKWVVGANAPDAADRALIGAIDLHRVARTFDELVIVSGDSEFSDLARRAKRFGLTVQVVTVEHPEQRTMLARELATIADTRTVIRRARRTSAAPLVAA